MKPRSTKYFTRDKTEKNKPAVIVKSTKAKAAAKSPIQNNTATQDNTGGGNDSGKRSDDN